MFLGTHTVEADFSDLKMTSGNHCTNLTNFSLESNLHSKQFLELQEIKILEWPQNDRDIRGTLCTRWSHF
jgi:hypothetical protein